MRVLDSRLHKAEQALAKHKKALLQSLERPLRALGYRLEPLFDDRAVSSDQVIQTRWPGGTKEIPSKIIVETDRFPKAVDTSKVFPVVFGNVPAEHRLICPDCDRTFALPLHLGRHRHAMHPNNR
jgi:hypothetical protein